MLGSIKDRRNDIMQIGESPVGKALFHDTRWAWIWLLPRLYVGWRWLQAGWGKLNNPAWVGDQAGTALSGFLKNAISLAAAERPPVQPFYAWFLENLVLPGAEVWSYVVAIGETLVGIALILGVFTGLAAFFGAFMNLNYLLAGTVSVNPILLILAIFILLAWRTAGWWGLDRWVIPAMGAPWSPGFLFQKNKEKA